MSMGGRFRHRGWLRGLIQPNKARLLGITDVRGMLPRGGTMLGSTNRANPFHYEVSTNGTVKVFDVSATVLQRAREYGIEVLLVIGGDGTMRIAQELMQQGLQVVGVPKTIDNDLYGTEVTIGFDTAVNTAMEALDKLHTTAESHHRVLVIELMGRHAGWIALAAGVAGGADVILIPEIPYQLDAIAGNCNNAQSGTPFSIVVVAEGSMPAVVSGLSGGRDLGGVARLGGRGSGGCVVAPDGSEGRAGHCPGAPPAGAPRRPDRLLATRFGAMAVHLIAQGKVGHIVALHQGHITAVPLRRGVAAKQVPLDCDLLHAALSLNICVGTRRQAIRAA